MTPVVRAISDLSEEELQKINAIYDALCNLSREIDVPIITIIAVLLRVYGEENE